MNKKVLRNKKKNPLADGYLNQQGAKSGAILDYPGVPVPIVLHDRVTLSRPGSDRIRRDQNAGDLKRLAQSGKPLWKYVARFSVGLTCQPTCGECLLVELDLALSKDDAIVVLHDSTLDRTTDGKGLVSDWSLKELKTLDAGSVKATRFKGERIPTFQEVLEIMPENIWLNVNLKGIRTFS
jgi:hypothetical protein